MFYMKHCGILFLLMCFCGCANLMRAFVPDSPRPNKDQLQVAKELSETSVSTIASLQYNKQEKMAQVAEAALKLISESKNPEMVEAASNIAANAFKAIEKANGTKDTLGKLQGNTMEDILRMNTIQYMAGITAQGTANLHNQETVYEGIKAGWQWSKSNIGMVAGLGSLLLGGGFGARILSTVSSLANKRSDLLKGQAQAIEDWKTEHPDQKASWDTLKSYLVNVHSQTPLNVKDELGLS